MDLLHEAWSGLLSWVPGSVRLSIAFALAVLFVTKILPPAGRVLGRVLAEASTPAFAALTLPEYGLTTLTRRIHGRPVPGAYGYGQLLGAVADGGRRSGLWLQVHLPRSLAYPRRAVVSVVFLILVSWHIAPSIGGSSELSQRLKNDLVRVDTWLSTGSTDSLQPVSCQR